VGLSCGRQPEEGDCDGSLLDLLDEVLAGAHAQADATCGYRWWKSCSTAGTSTAATVGITPTVGGPGPYSIRLISEAVPGPGAEPRVAPTVGLAAHLTPFASAAHRSPGLVGCYVVRGVDRENDRP
jgi:hypothetical protein